MLAQLHTAFYPAVDQEVAGLFTRRWRFDPVLARKQYYRNGQIGIGACPHSDIPSRESDHETAAAAECGRCPEGRGFTE
jgi:hypothetical protein